VSEDFLWRDAGRTVVLREGGLCTPRKKGSGQAARSIREQFVIEAFSPAKLARNVPDEEAPHDELSVGGGPGRS